MMVMVVVMMVLMRMMVMVTVLTKRGSCGKLILQRLHCCLAPREAWRGNLIITFINTGGTPSSTHVHPHHFFHQHVINIINIVIITIIDIVIVIIIVVMSTWW